MKITVIQGPNINMIGVRERSLYGAMTMDALHNEMRKVAEQNGAQIEFYQSNLEGEIVDRIQECYGETDAIILNPAAYTHTSIAIRDAISAVSIPVVEAHITNIARREEFRKYSFISPVAAGVISGFGPFGYHLALLAAIQIAKEIEAQKAIADQTKA
ncbi:MAG: type II 3-dehydroquinate dehydratase [Helicobacteraceae bacterium]|jgi:3-dehydroquinate dehydratase-2|nr:type II 3-dehydroquinate dehydratase [Helicobacteraceae bacterium]